MGYLNDWIDMQGLTSSGTFQDPRHEGGHRQVYGQTPFTPPAGKDLKELDRIHQERFGFPKTSPREGYWARIHPGVVRFMRPDDTYPIGHPSRWLAVQTQEGSLLPIGHVAQGGSYFDEYLVERCRQLMSGGG